MAYVAFLAEGVDRNVISMLITPQREMSPSSRRAWIEISEPSRRHPGCPVAFLAEGVDRNRVDVVKPTYKARRLPRGGRG